MKYLLEKDSDRYELMGGKATALSKIGKALDCVPDWFVVSYIAFDDNSKQILSEASEEIKKRLEGFSEDDYFAVRSSAGNEDSAENSFAGQFDTFLYVKKNNVEQKVLEVFLSAYSKRIQVYREESNVEYTMIPSAIVQRMVNSEKAGVAFGANPVNSNLKETVVSAVYGLGSGLVDGIATADTYKIVDDIIERELAKKDYKHVLEEGKVVQKEVEDDLKDKYVLNDDQIMEVKELVKKASTFFGRYQDIEWAYEGDKLYLLQSRPITTLTSSREGKINIFDNSNIVESYGGITTPLTFSFIRMVYENVYIELCKIFNVEQEKISMNSQMFKNMLALIEGRVYYNLYGWYGLLSMFPGLGNNKKFMEQMMGVKESLPDDLFPVPEATFKDKLGLVNTGWGLIKGYFKLKKMTARFYDRLNDALEDKNIDEMDLYELHDYYYELEKKLLHKWDAPLVNDFLAMIFYGQLKEECKRLFDEEGNMIHNDLLCDEGGIISSEPAKRIKEMAKCAKDNDELIALLENPDILYVQKELTKYPEFNQMLNAYLDKFADRCLEELKLETLTLKDNPRSLYASIATFSKRLKKSDVVEIDEKKNRLEAERKVKAKLRFKPAQKAKFNFILKNARYTVKNRENLRFERTRLFGRVRELFLRIGFILTSMNVIEDRRDIFYLEVDEILYYIDGKSTTNNLKELIAIRKNQYEKYNEMMPDERFYSYGAVNVGNDFKREKRNLHSENIQKELRGIGASPGKVLGKARVIKDPASAKLNQGEILVAEYTDPGWIMLFPAASGILVERGSLLSHSAIVSRELGIPAVVGITGLLESISTGDIVELDGTTGIVRVVSNDEVCTLKDVLLSSSNKYGNLVLYPQINMTYSDFKDKVESLGTALIHRGLKNEKIGIMSHNRYEVELAYMSIVSGVGTAVVIDKNLPKEEIENILSQAQMKAIFCEEEFKGIIDEIGNVEVFSFENDFSSLIKEGEMLLNNKNEDYINSKVNSDDICTIIFTSGTTADSKAIPLTHENLCSSIKNVEQVFSLNSRDVCLSILPFNHIYEQSFNFFNSFNSGCKRVFANEIDEMIDRIKEYNVTYVALVPAIYQYLYNRKDDLINASSHVKYFISAGAKIDEKLLKDFHDIGVNIYQAYGLSETSPIVCLETKEENKLGSVGKIVPGVEIKIVNKDDDGVGEIAVKGKNVFNCYYGDDRAEEYIKDEFFHTGDLGYIDKDGFLFICGRNKELIVLDNGKKVFPEELEQKINEIEGIKESFVFEMNSNIYAEVVCEKEYNENEKERIYSDLKQKINELNNSFPVYKRINDIYLSSLVINRNQIGKIMRHIEIKKVDELTQNKVCTKDVIASRDSNTDGDTASIIKEIIMEQLEISSVDIDNEFLSDLGADSLDMATIFLNVEKKYNIKIEREKRKSIKKVSDLIQLVKEI